MTGYFYDRGAYALIDTAGSAIVTVGIPDAVYGIIASQLAAPAGAVAAALGANRAVWPIVDVTVYPAGTQRQADYADVVNAGLKRVERTWQVEVAPLPPVVLKRQGRDKALSEAAVLEANGKTAEATHVLVSALVEED